VVRGDLDWIVMKCLEKDRTRRYETANGLAADIQRHINNEPVIARPPSVPYRFQKAFRRNKPLFTAAPPWWWRWFSYDWHHDPDCSAPRNSASTRGGFLRLRHESRPAGAEVNNLGQARRLLTGTGRSPARKTSADGSGAISGN